MSAFLIISGTMLQLYVLAHFYTRAHRFEKLFRKYAKMCGDVTDQNRELLSERVQWISENIAMRNEIAEWHAEAERRVVESQEKAITPSFDGPWVEK